MIIQNYWDNYSNYSRFNYSEFKRTINWNKYETKTTGQNAPNQYFAFLIEPCFQVVNRLFVLTFYANDSRVGHSRYFLPTATVEEYNVMIDRIKFFDQQLKVVQTNIKAFEKLKLVKDNSYTTDCLLDYNFFKKQYKMIITDLSKQQALEADPKPI